MKGESVPVFYLIYNHGQEDEERGVRLTVELMGKGRRKNGSRQERRRALQSGQRTIQIAVGKSRRPTGRAGMRRKQRPS